MWGVCSAFGVETLYLWRVLIEETSGVFFSAQPKLSSPGYGSSSSGESGRGRTKLRIPFLLLNSPAQMTNFSLFDPFFTLILGTGPMATLVTLAAGFFLVLVFQHRDGRAFGTRSRPDLSTVPGW